MVGWHQGLNGCEFEQTQGVDEGYGSLVCYSPWGSQSQTPLSDWKQQALSLCPKSNQLIYPDHLISFKFTFTNFLHLSITVSSDHHYHFPRLREEPISSVPLTLLLLKYMASPPHCSQINIFCLKLFNAPLIAMMMRHATCILAYKSLRGLASAYLLGLVPSLFVPHFWACVDVFCLEGAHSPLSWRSPETSLRSILWVSV